MLGEEFGHLGLDRLGQQGARSVAQHLGKRVGERPWLKQLDDVSIGHGVSLLCWRSGGANTPTIRRLHPVSPSPTFAHSSTQRFPSTVTASDRDAPPIRRWPKRNDTLPRATASWLTLISKNFSTGSITTA